MFNKADKVVLPAIPTPLRPSGIDMQGLKKLPHAQYYKKMKELYKQK